MKRFMIVLCAVFLFFTGIINVFAYHTLSYEINIPNSYEKEKNKDLWSFETENSLTTISIVTLDNTSKLNINKMSSETLDEDLLEDLNKSLSSEEKVNIKTSDLSLVKINGYNAIKLSIDSSVKGEDELVSTIYQTQYIFSSKNYLYYLIVSSSNKDNLISENINSIINSFTIKDELEVNNKKELKKYYITLGVIVLSGAIIMFMSKKK